MSRSKMARLVVVALGLVFCFTLTAFAQGQNPFTWNTWKDKNGTIRTYPRWSKAKGDMQGTNWNIGAGKAADPTGYSPDTATAKVYRPSPSGPPGAYESSPALTMQTKTFTTVDGVSTMTWSDTGSPKTLFAKDITVMVAISVKYKNNTNPDQFLDLQFPAFYVANTVYPPDDE